MISMFLSTFHLDNSTFKSKNINIPFLPTEIIISLMIGMAIGKKPHVNPPLLNVCLLFHVSTPRHVINGILQKIEAKH